MKKIIVLSLALLAVLSCNKADGNEPYRSQFVTPENKELHGGFVVKDSPDVPNPDGAADRLLRVDLPSSTSGVALYENYGPCEVLLEGPATRVTVGTTFTIPGVGVFTITFVGNDVVSFTGTTDDGTIEFSGEPDEDLPSTPFLEDLCRGWIVEKTFLTVQQVVGEGENGAGFGKIFNGCSPSEIADYVRRKGVDISAVQDGYDIRKVVFSENGTGAIFFKTARPYYVTFLVDGDAVSFDLQYTNGDNPSMFGDGHGKVTIANGAARMFFEGEGRDAKGKKYNVQIIIVLNPGE